jgi:hypothetical protein
LRIGDLKPRQRQRAHAGQPQRPLAVGAPHIGIRPGGDHRAVFQDFERVAKAQRHAALAVRGAVEEHGGRVLRRRRIGRFGHRSTAIVTIRHCDTIRHCERSEAIHGRQVSDCLRPPYPPLIPEKAGIQFS